MRIFFRNRVFKIFLILIFSFLLSSFFIKNVFLANSPKIRPNLGRYFLARLINFKNDFLATFDSQKQKEKQIIANLKKSLKPITKGVKAASVPGYSYTEFKVDEIEWLEVTFTLSDGRKITVRYPKGQEPPNIKVYENIGKIVEK